MKEAYKENLAFIHDAGFGHLAKDAAHFLLDSLKQAGIHKGRFVDIGCGSGITCRLLSDAGFEVTGIDISESLLEMARSRVPEGKFYKESFLTYYIPRCTAVAAIGEVMNYIFDETNDRQKRHRFFERVYEALEPGGCFLFDVAGAARAPSAGSQKTFSTNAEWAVLMETDTDHSNNILTRHITTFRKKGSQYERDFEVHKLQLLNISEIEESLKQIGFNVYLLDSYHKNLLPKGLVGFLALKEQIDP
ncbi:methyltransferase domain-containing protein [Aliifodinibius sp. S!AR15-10]|uniref:class I SAM-dependent methyltransferase n=1 Tax=Aliifodinibius sp. S!AR15-10 TaxID=2950437 RepID=UPI00285A9EE7|nr:methyltransferase domain-containing protein [Aliifodinibius sp. S!AR15-10]MDR8392627.1 methyltransferase domain-containing protein [Aliifodinibius sp. S!AR15-10]